LDDDIGYSDDDEKYFGNVQVLMNCIKNIKQGGIIMDLKPLEDRIIIKPLDAEEKTSGGIIIPDNAKEKPQKGEVVAVGPGKYSDSGNRIDMTLKKGDTVLYGKYSGTEVKIEGEDHLIMRESDVLAVM